MAIEGRVTIGMMMPADMGGAVARILRAKGSRVVTNLAGRSDRTRALAGAAGVEDLGDDREVVAASDIILSIVVPDSAVELAERLAATMETVPSPPIYVDCNAVAPATTSAIAPIIAAAGGDFVDAGIIGGPPQRNPQEARFYLSGPRAAEAADLLGEGIATCLVSARIGDASAVKMCYAALTKGTFAIMAQLVVAAERLGILDSLIAEFENSQPEQFRRIRSGVPALVPKAFRWAGEMEEIARTFTKVGVTGKSFLGAAATYAAVAETGFGKMRMEEWAEAAPPFEEVVRRLAEEMSSPDTS